MHPRNRKKMVMVVAVLALVGLLVTIVLPMAAMMNY